MAITSKGTWDSWNPVKLNCNYQQLLQGLVNYLRYLHLFKLSNTDKTSLTSFPVSFSAGKSYCCLRPFSPGYGNKSIPRWYFDPETGSCKLFSYRGKGGYGNIFASSSECLFYCRGPSIELNNRGLSNVFLLFSFNFYQPSN